jgi:hypothetical protein
MKMDEKLFFHILELSILNSFISFLLLMVQNDHEDISDLRW